MVTFLSSLYANINDRTTFIEWSLGGAANHFRVTFLIDFTSLLFLRVVLFISANVVTYRIRYMQEDKDADRFILLVFGFIISIALLILSPNIVRILLGWDGLGLISYCLVIYYPTKKSNAAGMLTVLRNRVGDICILIRIAWFRIIGDYSFIVWHTWSEPNLILFYLIIFAAMTKRAQLPFSAWLPAAMAAPTPVSALVHSSTLVTAGVYLLIRFGGFLRIEINHFLLAISTLTMFMSGLVANYEYDLKKVIALSTLSQLAVMIFSISLGLFQLAFFHLVIHALFKALLFLCAGAMIHGIGGSQDIRHSGRLIKNFPLIGVCLNYANLSLCGFPFLAGFYSKDIIVEIASQGRWNQFILAIMFISLGLTVGYSLRLTYFTFVCSTNRVPISLICDDDPFIWVPISNLCICSILSGATLSWVIFTYPIAIILPSILKFGAIIIIMTGLLVRLALTTREYRKTISLYITKSFVGRIWFLPNLSGQMFSSPRLTLGGGILKYRDQGWLEELTYHSVKKVTSTTDKRLQIFQANELKIHLLVMLLSLILLLLLI